MKKWLHAIHFPVISTSMKKICNSTDMNCETQELNDFETLYSYLFSGEEHHPIMFGIEGNLTQNGKVDSNSSINVSHLKKGIYVLKINRQSMKFLKK